MAPLLLDDSPQWWADTFLESQGSEPGMREMGRHGFDFEIGSVNSPLPALRRAGNAVQTRACKFRKAFRQVSLLLNKGTELLGQEMGNYVLATTTETDDGHPKTPGAINGGFYQRRADWPAQHPSVGTFS